MLSCHSLYLSGFLGNSYPSILQSGNQINEEKRGRSSLMTPLLDQSSTNKDLVSFCSRQSTTNISPVEDSNFSNQLSTLTNGSISADGTIAKGVQSVNSHGPSDNSNVSSNRSDLSMNTLDEGPVHESLDFEQFFQEGYCKASALSDCRDSAGVVTDADSSGSPCDREKCEEDGDNDDMLGGVFAFSEEGKNLKFLLHCYIECRYFKSFNCPVLKRLIIFSEFAARQLMF